MIQHYALYEINKLTDLFNVADGLPKGIKPRYNVAPTQSAPVVLSRNGTVVAETMKWGLLSKGAKDSTSVFRYKTFNVPSEKVFAKNSWNVAVRQTRCIIPMNGFYMIRAETGDSYYFTHHNGEMLRIAGIYTQWQDTEGRAVSTFSMLTIRSNDAMPLPFATMPVLLQTTVDVATWLDQDVNDLSSLVTCMRPYEGEALQYNKVKPEVSTKQDDASLIDPIK